MREDSKQLRAQEQKSLSQKSDIIADWFWHNNGSLRKICILIDQVEKSKFSIGQLQMNLE